MFIDDYIATLHTQLDTLKTKQPAVEQAAQLVADSLRTGHVVWLHEIVHAIQRDFINRAGGLASIRSFSWSFSMDESLPKIFKTQRKKSSNPELQAEFVRLVLKQSSVREGDIMIMGSVSGRNVVPVELAKSSKEMGLKVIAFTSMPYAEKTPSVHPSGKSLYEFADVVLDLNTPYGDAAMDIPGYESSLVPLSGFSAITMGWMLWGRVLELMGTDAQPPAAFMSVNREGGQDFFDKIIELWDSRGY